MDTKINGQNVEMKFENFDDWQLLSKLWNSKEDFTWYKLMFWSPLTLINFLWFINIDVGFYMVGLFQKSFWLIDPYWSILPFFYGLIWAGHPLATQNARGTISIILVFIWGVRLTHSYFRREQWKFGTREDWRYTKMALDYGWPAWYFMAFLTVGLAQHPMVVGISLPLYSVRFGPTSDTDLCWLDIIATVFSLVGIIIAWVSDNQLRTFMLVNEDRKAKGQPVIPILQTGLWKYSRHPNYFGEQLWWWSFALFSVQCSQLWAISGTAFNSLILYIVTDMTEGKMLSEWPVERAELFKKYQKRTSRCCLWPQKRDSDIDEQFEKIQ